VRTPVRTGIRVVDIFTPLCAGQRIGIFAGSGIGKSTLLSMLARAPGFDSTVLALVGERGREVREFLEDALGRERARTIAVVATGDESPMMRRLAAKSAMCIAEHLRDRGENVLLIVDSVTRFAHAARDVALAAGEPPVARGYPPSVFSDLPRLLERAGPGEEGTGSITGIFAVLVDGDDHSDPVADSIRGTLDGHVVLDRAIAEQGRYPPVNVLASISRLARAVLSPDQQKLTLKLREFIAQYEDTRDLRLMGGYRQGTDAGLDRAVQLVPRIYDVLRQSPGEPLSSDAFQDMARALAAEAPAVVAASATPRPAAPPAGAAAPSPRVPAIREA
jgi:flagellum-specific ATP synthase